MRPIIYVALLAALGCQDANVSPSEGTTDNTGKHCLQPEIDICVEYETMNEQGFTDTLFSEGENIIFSFRIINQSDQDVYLDKTQDFFVNAAQFMSIRNQSGDEVANLVRKYIPTNVAIIGIPSKGEYAFQVSYSPDADVVGKTMPNGSLVVAPFVDDSPPELSPGIYQSSFESNYVFEIEGDDQDQKYVFKFPLSLSFAVD